MYEERRWGYYKVLGQTDYEDGKHLALTKLLHLNAGCSISYQTHARREVWTFVDGEGCWRSTAGSRKSDAATWPTSAAESSMP